MSTRNNTIQLVVFALLFIFSFAARAGFEGACEYRFMEDSSLVVDVDLPYRDREELLRDIEEKRTDFWTQHRAKGIYRFWSRAKEGFADRLRKSIFQPRDQETPFRYKDDNPVVAFSMGLIFDEEIRVKKEEKDELLRQKASLLATIDSLSAKSDKSEEDRVELLRKKEELETLDQQIEDIDHHIESVATQQQKGLDLINEDLNYVRDYRHNINREIISGLNLEYKIKALKSAKEYFHGYEIHPEAFDGFWSSFFIEDPNNHSLILKEYTKWMVNWRGIRIIDRIANYVETKRLREREVVITYPKFVQESLEHEGEWKEERIVVHTRAGVDAELRGARRDRIRFLGGRFRKLMYGFGLSLLEHEREYAEATGRLKEFSRTIGRVFNRYKEKDASFLMPEYVKALKEEIEYNIYPGLWSPSVRGKSWLAWQLMKDEFRARRDSINEVSKLVLDEYVQRTGTAKDVKSFEKEYGVTDRSLLGFAQGFFKSVLRRLSLGVFVASTAVAGVFFQQTVDYSVHIYHTTQDRMLDTYYSYWASDETRIKDIISGRFLEEGKTPRQAFDDFLEEEYEDVIRFAFERDRALLAKQRLKEEGKLTEANSFPIPQFQDPARLEYVQYMMSYFAQEYNQRQRLLRIQQANEEELEKLRAYKREWRSVIFAQTSDIEEVISRIALIDEPVKRYMALETFFKDARAQDQDTVDQILLTIYNTSGSSWLNSIELESEELNDEQRSFVERLKEKRANLQVLKDIPGDFVLDINSFNHYQMIRDEYYNSSNDDRGSLLASAITERVRVRFDDHDFILDVIMELDLRLAEEGIEVSSQATGTEALVPESESLLNSAEEALRAAQEAIEAARQGK